MALNTKKSIFIKIIKCIGITLAGILVVMFVSPYVFSEQLEEQIKKSANKKLKGELNYSEANVSFFYHFPSLTLTLKDFNLKGAAPYQKEEFITAKAVSFGINISSLVFGESIDIDQVFLNDAFVNAKVNKNGDANYNVYIAEKETVKKDSSATSLKLEKIEIVNSKIIYDDLSTNIHIDALGFNYLGKGDLKKKLFDLHSRAKIEKLNIIYANEPYLMNKKVDADLITKVNVNSLSFIFEQNNLKINQLIVDLKGKFDFLKEGYDMDFIIKSKNSTLKNLFTAFPPKYISWLKNTELKGKTDILLTLKGAYIAAKKIAPNFNLDLKVQNGYVNYNKSAFPVSNLELNLSAKLPSLNPDLLILNTKSLALHINKDYLRGKLCLKGVYAPEVDTDLNAKIDLGQLNHALRIPNLDLKGILVGDLKAKGKYDSKNHLFPITKANVNWSNGYLKTQYYPNPITNINIIAKIGNQKGTFDDLKVQLNPTTFTFEGKPFELQADLSNFDDLSYDIKAKGILDISKIYKVFSQKGLDLNGSIQADLVLRGKQGDAEKGNYKKLYNKGTLSIKNIEVATTYMPKKILIKKGVFRFNQDKMYFNTFLASYGETNFKMNGYLQNVFNFISSKKGVLRGSFVLDSKYINIDEFVSNAVPNKVAVASSKTETNKQEVGVIMIPDNFDLKFQANAEKINFQGLHLQNGKGAVQMKKGKVSLQKTSFNLIGCAVTMNGSYKGVSPRKAQFEYQIKASDFDIKRAYNEVKLFREMASAAEKAAGIVSLDYKLKGRLNAKMEPIYPSLIGDGILSVKEVKLKGMKMFSAVSKTTSHEAIGNPEVSKVDIKTSVKNNIITIERFKFKFAGFRPRIEGTTSLDGKLNIKMRLGLPPLGILGIPLLITGNKDKPKVKIGRKSDELEETKDLE